MKADRDLGRSALHILAGAQVERHAGPAPIVDVQLAGNESLGRRIRRHIRFWRYARTCLPSTVPASYWPRTASVSACAGSIGLMACNDFGFLGADSIGIERDRRLHRRHRQKLEHMVRHHVAQRAGLLVELAAMLDADGLRHRDLDVVDLLSVPQRLEQAVGEAQRHNVLDRFLAEEMVDPIDLMLLQRFQDLGIERFGRSADRGRTAFR